MTLRDCPSLLDHVVLFLTERHAVRALVYSGIAFMGAHQDSLQRTEVGIAAVMRALGNGTFNALICVTVHFLILLSGLVTLV